MQLMTNYVFGECLLAQEARMRTAISVLLICIVLLVRLSAFGPVPRDRAQRIQGADGRTVLAFFVPVCFRA